MADDTVWRHVLQHHRYDPDRRERRHVLLAAYATEGARDRAMELAQAALEQAKADGLAEQGEWLSGASWPPGHDRRRAHARLLRRAVEHGAGTCVDRERLDLPGSVAAYRLAEDGLDL